MQLDEESLCVPVETALAHLVCADLDESVVPTFRLSRQLQRSKQAGERARARSMRGALEWKPREKLIGDAEHLCRGHLGTKEMAHLVIYCPGAASTTP